MEFLAGLGIGAIIAKLIDAVWVQPFIANKEHMKWLRTQRLEAFSDLSKNLLALSLEKDRTQSPFEVYGMAARTFLLLENRSLVKEIDEHIAERDRFFRVNSGDEDPRKGEDADKLYLETYMGARKIVYKLGDQLHSA